MMRINPTISEVRGIRVGDVVRVSERVHRENRDCPAGLMVVMGFDANDYNSIADMRELVSGKKRSVYVQNLEKVDEPE